MIRRVILATVFVLSLATMPSFAQFDIDLSGMSSNGLDGDFANETRIFNIPDSFFNVILQIDYDITIQSTEPSRLHDVNVRFGNSDGTFHGVWPDTFVPGDGIFTSGTQRFTGSFSTDIHLNPNLEFHVTLFELLDDHAGADAVLLEGSSMHLSVFIPSPNALGMLGVSAVVFGRRRRS
jgi:hypothetical protein